MFPNPQDALPLPVHPNLEQYKKRAKDLVKACRSRDADAIRAWAASWLDALDQGFDGAIESVAGYATSRLLQDNESCTLAQAQLVIARSHGFASWPRFADYLESLQRTNSDISAFERAADAIVSGDEATLRSLLDAHPHLVRARSTREHHATLLVYTSANGVEGYRQKSPPNAAAIAELLLQRGAEVDATADVYGSQCTTLGLVATSTPPEQAGVQLPIIDVLLKHGARMDRPGLAGHRSSLIRACLANGQPAAARHLVARGAPLDLPGAAGLNRVDVVRTYFDDGGALRGAPHEALIDAFSWACAYGAADAVTFLLDRGVDPQTPMNIQGARHTGLHVAAYYGQAAVVDTLLRRGARVDVADDTWKTTPLEWALAGWASNTPWDREPYYTIVERLRAAGAIPSAAVLESERVRSDARMRDALTRASG